MIENKRKQNKGEKNKESKKEKIILTYHSLLFQIKQLWSYTYDAYTQ